MKKIILLALFSSLGIKAFSQQLQSTNARIETSQSMESEKSNAIQSNVIYQFQVLDINGKKFDFSSLKGKKIMIVNTASKCGLTPQYKQLEAIYERYKDKNFVIVGFPANDFGNQEPGENEEIASFCSKNYGVTFPMMSKISVKGEMMDGVYQFLTKKEMNRLQDSEVEWNFQKYLINEIGMLEMVLSPKIAPNDESIIKWIKTK